MKKNAAMPFGLIAILGILMVIIMSVVGLNHADNQQAEEEEGAEEQQDGEAADDPETIFENNCANCHGGDLSGGMGPDLTDVGGRMSEDDIIQIIIEGKGDMPAGMATEAEAEVLAEWLSEMQ